MEVCFDRHVQVEVFVSIAWRHALLKHIEHTCTHMYLASNISLYAAMLASSGAPVLLDTCTIAGVHTGALFHLDDEHIKTDQHEVCFVILLTVNPKMPAAIRTSHARAYILHRFQCACSIMVCCCICMAAAR